MSQKWVLGIPMVIIAIAFGCLVVAFIDSQALPDEDEEEAPQSTKSSFDGICPLPAATPTGTDAASNTGNTAQAPAPEGVAPLDKPVSHDDPTINMEAQVGELVSKLAVAVNRKNEMGQYALVDDLAKLGKDALPLLEAAAAGAENEKIKAHIRNAITRIQAR